MKKRKALIYCRVSSFQQVKEGHGNDGQEDRCKGYAKTKGYQVVKVFRDEGISGSLFDRPSMKDLLLFVDSNNHEKYVLIFDDLKRFARDIVVHIKLKSEFQSRGIVIECPNFNFEDSPESEFAENILASAAQYERKSNAQQVINKQKARLLRGYWPFGAKIFPYEFITTEEHGKLLHPTNKRMASIIADCLLRFADGRLTNKAEMQIYLQDRDLYGDGSEVKKGLPERILSHVWFFAGYIEFPKWGVSRRDGHHKPIIGEEISRRIEDRLNNKQSRKLCKNKSDIFPLRKLVKCGCCQKDYTSSSPTNGSGVKVYRYTCNNSQCKVKPKNIEPDLLHGEYYKLLTVISPEKEIIDFAEAIAEDLWKDKEMNMVQSKKDQEKNLNLIIGEIEKCVDLAVRASGDVMREKYEARVESLEKQKGELEGKFDYLEDVNFIDALECAMDFIGTPQKYWQESGVDNKRRIHGLIFPEGLSFDMKNGFGTVEKALPFMLNEALCEPRARQVEMAGVEPASRGDD
ncbi:recombinase family protein [Patescibacteria group bacterium]|nr:recombinase family protein [Patescibacteria group bacterium]